jgi:hypothetical protein
VGAPLDVTLDQAPAAVAAKETRMRAHGSDPSEVSVGSAELCRFKLLDLYDVVCWLVML